MQRIGFAVLVWALLATFALTWNASAHARTPQPIPRIVSLVECKRPAEDSLAHLALVSIAHDGDTWTIVQRCKRTGY